VFQKRTQAPRRLGWASGVSIKKCAVRAIKETIKEAIKKTSDPTHFENL
jgi:hypothetical protein